MFVCHRGPSVGHRWHEVFAKRPQELYFLVLIGSKVYSIITNLHLETLHDYNSDYAVIVDTKCSRRDHKSCIFLCWLALKYILLLLTYIQKPYMIAIVTTRKRSSHKNYRKCLQCRFLTCTWSNLVSVTIWFRVTIWN